jgi:uncharacterized membrane protein
MIETMRSKKKIAILCYFTLLGWFFAFYQYQNGTKSSLTKFHLEQSLGLSLLVILSNLFWVPLMVLDPFFKMMFMINNMGLVILWIFGLLSASNGVRLPLPVIGFYFKDKFGFIQ